jgi:hypothetical protein
MDERLYYRQGGPRMTTQHVFDEPAKVEILLHEYDALRSEIVGRTNDGFNLLAVAGGLFGIALSLAPGSCRFWALAVIGLVVFEVARRETFYRIGRAAERLRQIEADINKRVGEEKPLLVWETDWGAADRGWFLEAFRARWGTGQSH